MNWKNFLMNGYKESMKKYNAAYTVTGLKQRLFLRKFQREFQQETTRNSAPKLLT